jgi:hypothetical protein
VDLVRGDLQRAEFRLVGDSLTVRDAGERMIATASRIDDLDRALARGTSPLVAAPVAGDPRALPAQPAGERAAAETVPAPDSATSTSDGPAPEASPTEEVTPTSAEGPPQAEPARPEAAEPRRAEPATPPPQPAVRPISPFPPRTERPKTDWSSAGRLIAAGVFGGALATVLGIVYHASGIIPTRADLTAADAVRQAQAVADKVATFEGRLATLETATSGLAALTEKVAALEKLEDTNRSRIENLENALPVAGGSDGNVVVLGPLEARVAATESTLASLGDKVTDLSDRLEEFAARPPPAVESERAARALAIGLLRQGAESGGAFAVDLAMLKALGMDREDIAALEPLARKGAPTIASLQAAFPSVVDAIIAATSAIDPDAGFFDRVAALGSSLVTIRPTTPIEGDKPEAIVSRMQDAVNRADLETALDEREKLSTEGQAASASWAAAAADRAAIDAIVERLALSVTPPAN